MNTFLEQNNVNQQLPSDLHLLLLEFINVIISPLQKLGKVGWRSAIISRKEIKAGA